MRRLIIKLLVFLAVIGVGGVGVLFWDYDRFMHSPMQVENDGMILLVEPGSNLTQIAVRLHKQGVLSHSRYLRWHARISGDANRISAGEYQLENGLTPAQFYQRLINGKVIQHELTLVEGWTFRQMMDAIRANANLQQTLDGLTDEQIMAQLGYPQQHPEGRFLPDTYYFPRGTSDVAFLKRAYAAMQAVLDQEWSQRAVDLPLKTPYEALILASIVEKETGLASERRAIAGVFTRRLQQRVRLQTDPTVIYGMGQRYAGNIQRKDLKHDTPYNTYTRHGLPPTPIAMPGRDAIHATLHPDESEHLYFVSKGDGSHYFSSTLEEHNRAVIKYQLNGRKRSFSSYKSE